MAKKIIFSKEQLDEMSNLYINGTSLNKLGVKYNTDGTVIRKNLSSLGIKTRDHAHSKQVYKINENFFDVIDTEEKAYWLGFLYADGSLTIKYDSKNGNKYNISIGLVEDDRDILDKFRECLETNRPLLYVPTSEGRYSKKGTYRLDITNKHMSLSLLNIGYKDKNVYPNIPNHLQRHFIRGVFDGDGCISFGRRQVKGKYSYVRADLMFMGEDNFLKVLRDVLSKEGIHLSRNKFVRNIYRNRASSLESIMKFKEYIYKDATIYLQRKYDKFADLAQELQKD